MLLLLLPKLCTSNENMESLELINLDCGQRRSEFETVIFLVLIASLKKSNSSHD